MRILPLSILLAASLGSVGCIKAMLTNGQISATREAAGSFNTLGDYELARSAAQAGLAQFEGMHQLAPDNEDALFLLTQGWVGYGFGFPEDDWEDALDRGDDDSADYHKKRATMAYERAVFYGLELLSHNDKGFAAAKKNADTFKKWLDSNFNSKDDVPNIFWTGYGWMAKVNVNKDNPELVGDLFVGVELLEKAVALEPSHEHWSGIVVLAAYHARPMGELEQSKQMFDMALERTQHKNLLLQVTYAQTYACQKGDRALYEKLLNEVLAAQDPDPEQRLANTLAKRRAKRYLGKHRMMDCGFDMSSPGPKAGTQGTSPSTPASVSPAPAPAKAPPATPPAAKGTAPPLPAAKQ
jgi:hypothetical protein